MLTKTRTIYLFIFFCLLEASVFSQDGVTSLSKKPDILKYSGSLNLSSEFYNASSGEERLPSNLQKAIFRSVVTIYDQIQLPFEIYLSSQKNQFQQPFNQFGVSPRFSDWLKLHAGYFSANISELSFGDVRLLGGGAEITPGNFRLKILYGISRKAIDPERSRYYYGTYKQTAYAASVGYGNISGNYLDLNIFHAIDDSSSIKRDSLTAKPNENLVASVNFGLKPIKELTIRAEAAVSAFSNDITAAVLEDASLPSFFFSPKTSTQADGAAKITVSFAPGKDWSLQLGGRWIGPGFTTLGYAQLVSDVLEFTMAPKLRLIEGRLNLNGSFGLRTNNLRNNLKSTTRRYNGYFNADYQLLDNLGFNLQYNNNQIRSSFKNDTLKISNVLNYLMISPRYNFEGLGGMNNIVVTYSYQNSMDRNRYTTTLTENTTNMANIMHSLYLPSSLSFCTSFLYNSTSLSLMSASFFNVSETAGYMFFDRKLNASATVGFSTVKTTSNSTSLVFRLNASYSLGVWGALSFNISNSNYKYSDSISPSYNEIMGAFQYDISF